MSNCFASKMWNKCMTRTFEKAQCRHISFSNVVDSSKLSSAQLVELEKKNTAAVYEPLPVVISEGKGCVVKDREGKRYLDFLAGYAAVNTGHCHPKIIATAQNQMSKLTHTSRAYFNDQHCIFADYITKYFKFDKVLPMNTGVEGGDTAIKIARKWAYLAKGVKENQAVVVFPRGNFWGRSLAAVSASTTKSTYEHYGPFMPGFTLVPYDDPHALEEVFRNKNVCAYMLEPIQGEGGIIVPSEGYLKIVRSLCTKYNVLMIADEVQTGLGRTGALNACDHEEVRPDILVLGKGLAGTITPMSAVLADDEIMQYLTPGTHGSTFGGNPLASAVAMTTLDVIKEEGLVENARKMGEQFRAKLRSELPEEIIPIIRGKGLMNAIQINPDYSTALELTLKLVQSGLLAKSGTSQAIRMTPPLTISEAEIDEGVGIIVNVVKSLKK